MDLKYFVDEEAKRVVCTITYEESFNTIYEDIRKATVEFTPFYNGIDRCEVRRILKRYNYQLTKSTGIAVCYDGDEFDLETGKRIARRKALDKYYSKRANIFRLIIKEFEWTIWRLKDKSRPLYSTDEDRVDFFDSDFDFDVFDAFDDIDVTEKE